NVYHFVYHIQHYTENMLIGYFPYHLKHLYSDYMNNNVSIVVVAEDDLKSLIRETVSEELEKFEQRFRERKFEQKVFGDKLRIKDVAEFLGCSTKTVSTYRKKGILPEPKTGLNGKLYWDKDEIVSALRARDLAYKFKL
ncbi:MAG: helix-turn-helix domain-containing protein, partial [Bacteroidetes bacterium]|nr:helix-turn-helix domain-containing protein [Bacteroidota bacterium]